MVYGGHPLDAVAAMPYRVLLIPTGHIEADTHALDSLTGAVPP